MGNSVLVGFFFYSALQSSSVLKLTCLFPWVESPALFSNLSKHFLKIFAVLFLSVATFFSVSLFGFNWSCPELHPAVWWEGCLE